MMKLTRQTISFLLSLLLALSFCFLSACEAKLADATAEPEGIIEEEGQGNQAGANADPDPVQESDETWAVYWYLCGTDLETNGGAATNDLWEMSQIELPENVQVIIQTGGTEQWQNELVDSTKLCRFLYDAEGLEMIDSQPLASMGKAETLTDFLSFCTTNYPADKQAVILWDHGGGTLNGICHDELFDETLSLSDLDAAFSQVFGGEDTPPLEIMGFDACLMASIDTASVFSGIANYLVASEETEPGCGWDYTGWLGALAQDPSMDGAQLGQIICETYYQGCVELDVEPETTLSVVDLNRLGELNTTLGNAAFEGINGVLSDPTGFFAQYGRGAYRAENYSNGSDGYQNMVDLYDLIEQNLTLFPQNGERLLELIDECVVYRVNGSYRTKARGISCYYPYDGLYDSYLQYRQQAYSKGLPYLYEMLFEGQLSDVSIAAMEEDSYIDDGFDSGALSEAVEYADMGSMNLEDHPVDILDEGDTSYAVLNIGPEAAASLSQISFELAMMAEDESYMIYLGEEVDIDCDWDAGIFTDNFRSVWGSIGGELVTMSVSAIADDYVLYDVPVMIDGDSYTLTVSYSYVTEDYTIHTATLDSNSVTGLASKRERLLVPGDEITPVYLWINMTGEGVEEEYFLGNPITITKDTRFEEMALDAGAYKMLFTMTDYAGNTYSSELVDVTIS